MHGVVTATLTHRLGWRMMPVALLAWVSAPGAARADGAAGDVATTIDLTAARAVIAADATCVPPALRPGLSREGGETGRLELQLGLVEGAPLLCAHLRRPPPWVDDDDDDGPPPPLGVVGCWRVDPSRRRLAPVPPRLLPGQPVAAELVGGCSHGLCLPPDYAVPADAAPMVVIDPDGNRAAVLVLHHLNTALDGFVFARRSRTLTGRFRVAADDVIMRSQLVGGVLTMQRCKAAPHCVLHGVRVDGASPGHPSLDQDATLLTVAARSGRSNVHLGAFSVIDDDELLLADAGWANVARVVPSTGAIEQVRRGRPSRCVRQAMDGRFSPCAARLVLPYVDAQAVATPTGYLARLSAPRAGDLVVLDRRLRERARWSAFCPATAVRP